LSDHPVSPDAAAFGTPSPRRTLKDIARHAGVSVATVSLVFQKSPLVAETTRLRVLDAVETLGYIYNRGAASLRTQRTHTIGVAINDLTNPYFAELTAAIELALSRVGFTVFLSNSAESPERQERFIATMREYNADGLIVCPAEGTDAASLDQLVSWGLPCVQISRHVPGAIADYVGNDHELGSFLATEHLIGLGHRRIAMIGGTPATSTGRDRVAGYRRALAAHGIEPDPHLARPGPPTREHGFAALQEVIETEAPPTAAVCFNDLQALGVMLGLRHRGLEPGRDFAVMGCDDISEAALWRPALSTVAIRSPRIGEVAAQMLLDRLANPGLAPQRTVLEPRLIVRESCGRPLPHLSRT
jgi:LacI family transcriptional regulator